MIPGTRIRFGLEPIIGLIPILGDQATVADVGGSLISERRHRLPKIATDPHGAEYSDQWGMWEWYRSLAIFLYSGTNPISETIRSWNDSPAKPAVAHPRRLVVCIDPDWLNFFFDCDVTFVGVCTSASFAGGRNGSANVYTGRSLVNRAIITVAVHPRSGGALRNMIYEYSLPCRKRRPPSISQPEMRTCASRDGKGPC